MKKYFNLRDIAIISSATFLSASIATGLLVGGALKYFNPADIDVWQPLAYLAPTLLTALVAMVTLAAIALAYIMRLRDTERTLAKSARLPLVILVINLVLAAAMLAGQQVERAAQDNWARANGQPTHAERDQQLDQFFENLD